MELSDDGRYRAGVWIAEHLPESSPIGITSTFLGDTTYGPRFPIATDLRLVELQLRPDRDPSRFWALDLAAVATADYSVRRARGNAARVFVDRLTSGRKYYLEAEARPEFGPIAVLARAISSREPADLSYSRARFLVYTRRKN
jgi:hypothetical protein